MEALDFTTVACNDGQLCYIGLEGSTVLTGCTTTEEDGPGGREREREKTVFFTVLTLLTTYIHGGRERERYIHIVYACIYTGGCVGYTLGA